MNRHSIAPLIALCLSLLAACSAPTSRALRGPVGDEVRASLRSGRGSFDHSAWGRLLAEGTRAGLVDYGYFQAHRSDLDAYLARAGEAGFASLAPSHLEALLINAYNAFTIQSILDHPGVTSIRQIDGVWNEIKHRVGGHDLTLDEIEHNLLRPYFKDPRIHFAVNCASRSCAPLAPFAYDGARLEEQLEARAKAFLTDPRQVSLAGGALAVSRYFDWYGADFTAPDWKPRADSVAAFIAVYAAPEIGAFIRESGGRPTLVFLDYDWSLNSAPPPGP